MENSNYKSAKYLNNMQKNQFIKIKNNILELETNFIELEDKELTLFSLRCLGPLYHFVGEGWGGYPPLVFPRSTCPIHFKLDKYLIHHKYFQKKSKWYPRSRDFLDDLIIFSKI